MSLPADCASVARSLGSFDSLGALPYGARLVLK